MIKKMLWLVILVLIAVCSVYFNDGVLNIDPGQTAIATDCADCTVIPATEVVTEIPVDATATSEVLPTEESTLESTATVAETATLSPTEAPTETALPTSTVTPTFTATAVPPTATPTLTSTPTEVPMTFAVQTGSPVYMVNFVRTSAGCNWSGIAGQVFDNSGKPLTGYIVKITGIYNSAAVSTIAVTGMVTGTPYGPSSYEVVLGTKALDSTDLLSIQLFDPSGNVLTTPLRFSTYADCSKNLVIINFKQK